MATTVAPAWYADPSTRHRLRYWDGEHWTDYVSDLGDTAVDELPLGGQGFEPGAPQSSADSFVTAAPPPSAPRRTPPQDSGRPRRASLAVGIAAAAVVSLIAGLLVWAPWTAQGPPAPTGVRSASLTATSVVVSWTTSTGDAKVDRYVILRNGVEVATVPGGTASYRDQRLRPAERYRYSIVAEHGTRRSSPSPETVAHTLAPMPVRVVATATSTTSVAVHWAPPPKAPAPDRYVILRNGTPAKAIAGNVTSYADTGRTPGTTLKYRIAAVWSGRRSTPSTVVTVTIPLPPVSEARLRGSWQIDFVATSSAGGSIDTGMTWVNWWQFTPQCPTGPCTVVVSGVIAPPGYIDHDFTATLTRDGAVYSGTTSAHITHCGIEPNVVEVVNQITLRITATTAQMNGTSWNARKLTGTMTWSAPYTAAGNYYCPAQSVESSLTAAS